MKRNYLIPYERIPHPVPRQAAKGMMCNFPKYLKELGMGFHVHPMRAAGKGGAAGHKVLLVVEGTEEQFAKLELKADVRRMNNVNAPVRDG